MSLSWRDRLSVVMASPWSNQSRWAQLYGGIWKQTLALLLRHEGLELRAYYDSENRLTGGIGHLLPSDTSLSEGDPIEMSTAMKWFMADVEEADDDVSVLLPPDMQLTSEPRRAALLSMAFNLGRDRLREFRLMWQNVRRYDDELTAGGTDEDSEDWWWRKISVQAVDSNWAGKPGRGGAGERAWKIGHMLRNNRFPEGY